MKKIIIYGLILCLLAGTVACSQIGETEDTQVDENGTIAYNGTIFNYNGVDYDISQRDDAVNSINGVTKVSEVLLVEGHINPDLVYYGVFDTYLEDFASEFYGTNLIWHSNDITTAIYASWNEIYDYYGNSLGDTGIDLDEYIQSITFIEDNAKIEVEILNSDQQTEYLTFDVLY